jgi:inosine-uridine nucleoside N-ribohydrolase
MKGSKMKLYGWVMRAGRGFLLTGFTVLTVAAGPASSPSLAASAPVGGEPKRLVLIDQDGSGPGGSNQMSMMVLLQAPQVEVLGITIVTGNAWRDDEARHTLRMLELIGRSDVPVALGAVFPLVRTQQETALMTSIAGGVGWLGAWGEKSGLTPGSPAKSFPGPWDVPPLQEGEPHSRAIDEDAAHFLIRKVREHPHDVTIYAAGPLTNIALAITIDPHFAELTRGIVIMGGSLDPQTDDPEFATSPRHEFNFWFDPEAARITLRAPWPRIDLTTVDVSIKAMFTQAMLDDIAKSSSPAARYIAAWSQDRYYLWDELAACAWLDPRIITKRRDLYMDVDVSHGPTYGETLTWDAALRPKIDLQLVHAQVDLDLPRFTRLFDALMKAPGAPRNDGRTP